MANYLMYIFVFSVTKNHIKLLVHSCNILKMLLKESVFKVGTDSKLIEIDLYYFNLHIKINQYIYSQLRNMTLWFAKFSLAVIRIKY